MCVAAIPAIGGLASGAQSGLFLASLGIQGAQMIQKNRAARQAANYQYEAARRSAESAERAFAQQQEGLAANLKETRAAKAQERLAATIQDRRNALGLLAQRDSRLNAATDMQNQAYATARANTSSIFDFLGAGAQSYTNLLGNPAFS